MSQTSEDRMERVALRARREPGGDSGHRGTIPAELT
jgi:hypothetical protein